MSRVAERSFPEETRSALDIGGKHVTIQGPSPDLCPARSLAPFPGLVGAGQSGWRQRGAPTLVTRLFRERRWPRRPVGLKHRGRPEP